MNNKSSNNNLIEILEITSTGTNPLHKSNVLKLKCKVLSDDIDENTIQYIAANPADTMTSYSGSGLPFHNFDQAYESTPNKGKVIYGKSKQFTISIKYPNSYYIEFGNKLIYPHIKLMYKKKNIQHTQFVYLKDRILYRTLTYPHSRKDVSFYDVDLPIRSQESILKDSMYIQSFNDKEECSFWGLKPPL